MKPRKAKSSTPAGVPHLQEVGFTISYQNVVVTEAKLDKLKKDQEEAAKGMAKYGRYKAWLHYANLQSWQRQGHHFRYLSGQNAEFCTCGLALHKDGTSDQEIVVVISKAVEDKLDFLNLEEIQKVRGYVGLPSLKGETVALIVDYIYREDLNDYLWTVNLGYHVGLAIRKMLGNSPRGAEEAAELKALEKPDLTLVDFE